MVSFHIRYLTLSQANISQIRCGHCKAMTPAFDEVADLFNGPDSQVSLAFVDCTVQTELCSKHGVSGYPTLKVFDSETGPNEGKPYNGGRDVNALKTYVEENMKPKCGFNNVEGCSDKEKTFMEKMKSVSTAEIADQIARLDKMKGSSMAPDLKKWVYQRLNILKELQAQKQ